jgi:hypothetical protein
MGHRPSCVPVVSKNSKKNSPRAGLHAPALTGRKRPEEQQKQAGEDDAAGSSPAAKTQFVGTAAEGGGWHVARNRRNFPFQGEIRSLAAEVEAKRFLLKHGLGASEAVPKTSPPFHGTEDGDKAVVAELRRRYLETLYERRHGRGWCLPEPDRCRAELTAYKQAEPELYKELHARIAAKIQRCRDHRMQWRDPIKQGPMHSGVYCLKPDLPTNGERNRLIRLIYLDEIEPQAARAKAEQCDGWAWWFDAFTIGESAHAPAGVDGL